MKHTPHMGHFRVVGELGQGGMGSVFIGLDENLGRRVALKVIRSDQRLDPVRKARFLREAQVLSSLDHPNICQFHDFIEGKKQDYLVLELVEGRSLREAMDEGLDEALKIGIAAQLLDVLVAVHSKGVVHRDLKPENIMLTDSGDIKVLDFGLARPVEDPDSLSGEFRAFRVDEGDALDGTTVADGSDSTPETSSMTTFGTVLGTIGYMSPEVARGEPATAASDLYSAGLIMQEVFAGQRPIPDELAPAERHRRAMWGEVEPVTGLSAELTTLIRRLESLVPENRPTAIDAAEMLQTIRLRPRLRRRRQLAVAVIALLAVFGIGMTIQYYRAERETRRAEAGADAAQEVSDFLVGLFEQASPMVTQGEEITVGELLKRGADSIDEELREQPAVRARMMYTLGTVYYHLGRYDEAAPLLEEALSVRREVLKADDPELGESLRVNGVLARARGRYDEAERLFSDALVIAEAGPDGKRSIDSARLLVDLAGIDQDRGRWAEAELPLLGAVAIYETYPDGAALGLTDALFDLAALYRKLGRIPEVEKTLHRCLELDTEEFGLRSHQVAGDLAELSALATIQGQGEKAEKLSRRSLEIRFDVYGEEHPYVGHSLTTLGVALRELGRYAESEVVFRQALEVYRNAYGEEHPFFGNVLHSLGTVAVLRGDLDAAAALLEESIRITAISKGMDHPLVADSTQWLAVVRRDQGRYEEAVELFERALVVQESTLEEDHPNLVKTLEEYAECLRMQGRLDEAAVLEDRVEKVRPSDTGRTLPN